MEDVTHTPRTREDLLAAMRTCDQTAGMTVLQHGEMVADYYRDLSTHVRDGQPLRHEWRLPEWIGDAVLWEDLPDDATMAEYHVFHDAVIITPQDASRQHPKEWSPLRIKTTMTVTNADKDTSPDFSAMATTDVLGWVELRLTHERIKYRERHPLHERQPDQK